MDLSRRDALRILAAAPLVAVNNCCTNEYPEPLITASVSRLLAPAPILEPRRLTARASAGAPIVDVHAHFFNGSDVPVKGFIAECLGHNPPPSRQPLLHALALLADKIAELAPTARDELSALQALAAEAARTGPEIQARVDDWFRGEREAAAQRVVDVVRRSEFERRYREMTPAPSGRPPAGITQQEVLDVTSAARQSPLRAPGGAPRSPQQVRTESAKATLEFLFYMLSRRASNVRTYIDAYAADDSGVDTVIGSLVDFDYWLECPPRSAHEDQIALHQHLATLHGRFMRPVVAYNPWTDIVQNGAGLDRVVDAWTNRKFVGVKIYPPTGFMPAANATTPVKTQKRRPDLKRLDDVLATFFTTCARHNIPVIAHAAHSFGRDSAHDEFSAPAAWERLIGRFASETDTPILNLGHFGGDDADTQWTQEFADLMRRHPNARLFADLGFWDQLMCDDAQMCEAARDRLKSALAVRINEADTVADRAMFATDWLMFSQVPGWRSYLPRIRGALVDVATPDVVDRVLGLNARKCFPLGSS